MSGRGVRAGWSWRLADSECACIVTHTLTHLVHHAVLSRVVRRGQSWQPGR
jgi:hypothetical protein